MWNISTWATLPSSAVRVPAALNSRVYVLSLPSRFNEAVDTAITMKHGVYLKAERIVHTLLLRSAARATTLADASRYFVPLYVGMLGNAKTESGRRHARLAELDAALEALHTAVPLQWPAHSAKFVFVVSLDRGRCFQDDGVDRFRHATLIMHDGTQGYPRAPGSDPSKPPLTFPCHRRGHDIAIPPPTDLGVHTTLLAASAELRAPVSTRHPNASFPWSFFTHRNLLVVWRGSATRTAWASATSHATTGTAQIDVRPALIRAFGGRPNASTTRAAHAAAASAQSTRIAPSHMPALVSTRKVAKEAHYAEMRRSIFCLAPSGWALWTVRFFEAVHLGCIPITFLPHALPTSSRGAGAAHGAAASVTSTSSTTGHALPLRMPFEDELDYGAFSLNVQPREAHGLRHTLEMIAANRSRLRAMQRALWAARPAFDWTDTGRGGAFHRTLGQLAKHNADHSS